MVEFYWCRYVRYYERIIYEGGVIRNVVKRVVYRIRLFNWKADMPFPKIYFFNHDGPLLKVRRNLEQSNVNSSDADPECEGIGWKRLTKSCLELVLPKLIVEGDFKVRFSH